MCIYVIKMGIRLQTVALYETQLSRSSLHQFYSGRRESIRFSQEGQAFPGVYLLFYYTLLVSVSINVNKSKYILYIKAIQYYPGIRFLGFHKRESRIELLLYTTRQYTIQDMIIKFAYSQNIIQKSPRTRYLQRSFSGNLRYLVPLSSDFCRHESNKLDPLSYNYLKFSQFILQFLYVDLPTMKYPGGKSSFCVCPGENLLKVLGRSGPARGNDGYGRK